MIVLEMKAVVKPSQCSAIDEAIRTVQFIRNKALRLWMDAKREDKIDKYSLNKYCAVLAKQFKFVDTLNSTARQASAERAWSAIARFYDNCKKKVREHLTYAMSINTYRCQQLENLQLDHKEK
jgi:transposase